jgi:hypothetical protein
MTEPAPYMRTADNSAFLAVSAGNFHDADMALFKVKSELAGKDLSPGQQAHLDQLRQRRKDAYADLVIWVMTVEAERLGVPAAQVTPVTSTSSNEPAVQVACRGTADCDAWVHTFACIANSERPT